MVEVTYYYEYDDDGGRYCYSDSGVLKNKLGIEDFKTLRDAERELSMVRYFDLETKGITGDFSLKHLCSIHEYLFGDVYEWAGQIRTVDISKGTLFCLAKFITEQFDIVYRWIVAHNYLKDVTDEALMAKDLAYVIGEINMIHPFREGNGRTQRLYLEQLCKAGGHFELSFAAITRDEMLKASIDTSVCKYDSMEELLSRCIRRTDELQKV